MFVTNDNDECFRVYYLDLLRIVKENKVTNVGAVNLITVLYFMSGGAFPIYDYFAHRAVKALFLGKTPCDVFMGATPDKSDVDKVVAMYAEYCSLLMNVFGRKNIDRELDQSLWVYGHATTEFKELNNIEKEGVGICLHPPFVR